MAWSATGRNRAQPGALTRETRDAYTRHARRLHAIHHGMVMRVRPIPSPNHVTPSPNHGTYPVPVAGQNCHANRMSDLTQGFSCAIL